MPKLTGAHLFIRCLKLEGIEKVFTIVGDTILPLVDAAADEGALVALREQAAETPVFPISAVSGEGIEALLRFLAGSVNSARSRSRSPEKPASLSIPGR